MAVNYMGMSLGWFVGEFKFCLDGLINEKWKSITNQSNEIFYSMLNTTKQLDCLSEHGITVDELSNETRRRLCFLLVSEMQKLNHLLDNQIKKYHSVHEELFGKFKGLQAKFKSGIVEEKSLSGLTKNYILDSVFNLCTMAAREIRKKQLFLEKLRSLEQDLSIICIEFVSDEHVNFFQGTLFILC